MSDSPALDGAGPELEAAASDHGSPQPGRESRFLAGLERLARGNSRAEILLILGAILVPSGIVAIVLGWKGAAATGYVFEQVPFLVSGAALGIALVFLGGFCFFSHWLTVLLAETRRQSDRLADQAATLKEIQQALAMSNRMVFSDVDVDGEAATPPPPTRRGRRPPAASRGRRGSPT